MTRWIITIHLLMALLGCGASGPGDRLDDYAGALRDRRYEDAYAMMSAAYRQSVSESEFTTRLKNDRAAVLELVALLQEGRGPVVERAEVQLADGTPITFRKENEEWLISSHTVDFYSQASPRLALRTFIRAVERRRYDVLLSLVPQSEREGMTEASLKAAIEGEDKQALEVLVGRLRASMQNPIEEIGDSAVMRYAGRFAVRFVREEGVWRIQDPD